MRERVMKFAATVALLIAAPFLMLFALGQCLTEGRRPRKRRELPFIGALALCLLMIVGTLPVAGCSGTTVAQDIVNWTPSLQSAVTTVDSTAALLVPLDAPIFAAATVGFDAASNLLVAQAKAYLANPSAGILAQLQTQVVTLQQQVNAALLKAGRIVDPASQQHALSVIGVVATVVNAILALVQSISSKVAVAAMASASTIKLARVDGYIDRTRAVSMLSQHYRESMEIASAQESLNEAALVRAGF